MTAWLYVNGTEIAVAGSVSKSQLDTFSIKQPVFFVCINWEKLISLTYNQGYFF